MNPSRRNFLKAGAVAAAAGLGGSAFRIRSGRSFAGGMAGVDSALGHRFRDGGFPEPASAEDSGVLIVGGGIAGLSAARELDRLGLRDWKLLELEAEAGGNAASGRNAVSEFPWGAHYVPLPGADAPEVTGLFEELGIITGRDARGLPVYREEFLCHDPQERLFVDGRWQEGLVPQFGIGAGERAGIAGFLARMEELRVARGNDGKPLFAVPVDRSSRDPAWLALDRGTFSAWLAREGYASPALRWYADYCCRDDFGAGTDRVSAWAGLHYFASRRGEAANAPGHSVVTWPAGNGWLAGRLRAGAGDRCVGRVAVFRVVATDGGVEVWAWHAGRGTSVRHRAKAVVLAVPQFVAARMLGPAEAAGPRAGGTYAPWMVANLTLRSMPRGRGAPPAWDNVMRDSRSLGYVVATHQSLHPVPQGTVLTYYQPLDERPPAEARRAAAERGWESWCEQILADLAPAHPDIADLVERIDVRVWGHGMACPVPGWIWDGRRERLARPLGPIHFAHSDLGGMSLFEEALVQGTRAARDVAAQLAGKAGA